MADAEPSLSIGVEKDAQTKTLCLSVLFQLDASNITLSKTSIAWFPTAEELDLLHEAFALLPPASPAKETTPSHPQHTPHLSEKDPSIREQATDAEIRAAAAKKAVNDDDKVLVQVDDKLIDEAIQRRKADITSKNDANSVVDRLTKKRKLG